MSTTEELQDEPLEELVEIELYAKAGKPPPRAKAYVIRVDKTKITMPNPIVTGREILIAAHKAPVENYILRQIFSGGRSEIVRLEQHVDLRAPGVEKFKTLPRDQTEG